MDFDEYLIGANVVEGDLLEPRLDVYLPRNEGLGCYWHGVIERGYVGYLEGIMGIQKAGNIEGDRFIYPQYCCRSRCSMSTRTVQLFSVQEAYAV